MYDGRNNSCLSNYGIMYKGIFIFSFIVSNVFGQYDVPHFKGAKYTVNKELSKQIFQNINEHRDSIGREQFEWNETMYQSCVDNSLQLIKNAQWGHGKFEKREYVFEILTGVDVTGESIVNYYDVGVEAVIGWIGSKWHIGSLESLKQKPNRTSAETKFGDGSFNQTLAYNAVCCAIELKLTNGQHVIMIMHRGYNNKESTR